MDASTGIIKSCVSGETTDAGEIVEAALVEVKPCPGKDYICHPTTKMFLEETSLDPLASDKRKRLDYR